ncbi:hypothetical protein, partial [Burkholderia multivorans]|uniref:hypothetical protein n=1 Tax=Burkholderia multivorans TaxID=87883 RepID=UPI001C65AEB5
RLRTTGSRPPPQRTVARHPARYPERAVPRAPAGKTLFSFVVNVSNAQYLRVPIWFRVAANR